MSKKIVVQAYNSNTGVIGPVESESACVQQFSNQFGTVTVGMFVCISVSSGKAAPAQANDINTLAYGIVTKLISNTLCEVMTSGITTLTVAGALKGNTLYLSPSAGGIVTRDITDLDSDGYYLQPVARVLGVATGSVCTIQLLIAGAPVADLSNLLKLDRFIYAANSNDGRLVIGGNDDELTPDSDGYKLEVIGGVKASSHTVTGQVEAASASITGQVQADSAVVSGNITAGSATVNGGVGVVGSVSAVVPYPPIVPPNPLDGVIYAATKVGSGNTILAPSAYLDGATGTVHGIDVEASGTLTGEDLSVTGSGDSSIATNGGIVANGKISGKISELTNTEYYGSLSVNKYSGSVSLNHILGIIRLAAVQSAGGSPAGGSDLYCFAGENWGASAKGSRLSLRTTTFGTTTLSARITLDQDAALFHQDIDLGGNAVLPFTGAHVYPCNIEIPVGSCVVLNNGTAGISNSAMAKNCVGLAVRSALTDTDSLAGSSEGLKVVVAAVGDNRSGPLTGFLICDEGGPVSSGDLLCTSSTPGYLMKQPDDIVRSYTVGKALQDVTFDADGKASGVYGTICCG